MQATVVSAIAVGLSEPREVPAMDAAWAETPDSGEMEGGTDAEATAAWLDDLTSNEFLDALPQPQTTPETLAPEFQDSERLSPDLARGTQQAEKTRRRPAAKRVRQNAESQRAYRRRKKAQESRVVSATTGLQQYIAEADALIDELLSTVFDDEIMVERLLAKLAPAEAEATTKEPLGRSFLLECAQYTRRLRKRSEGHQRQLLSLPGDKYIEGETDALAWLSREVNTHKKAALDKVKQNGKACANDCDSHNLLLQSSAKCKWDQLALLPEALTHYGGTMSDALAAFVRWGAERPHVYDLKGHADAASATLATAPRVEVTGLRAGDCTQAQSGFFNVSMAFRKLQSYLDVIHKYDALRYALTLCDFWLCWAVSPMLFAWTEAAACIMRHWLQSPRSANW